jgi:hypothetical protein
MAHIEPKQTEACLVEDVKEARDVLDVDARLQDLARKSPPFYRKRNLTTMYLLMVPGCLVPAVTLGFDGAMMNGLQAISTWNTCMRLTANLRSDSISPSSVQGDYCCRY